METIVTASISKEFSMHTTGITLADVQRQFTWAIPEHYNIGTDVCDRWADSEPNRLAIIDVAPSGQAKEYSFKALKDMSNRLAQALSVRGVKGGSAEEPGDRIAVLLPQCVETAVSHITAARMGCISMPLFTLFGPEALFHRLSNSGASVMITNADGFSRIEPLLDQLPMLKIILSVDGANGKAEGFAAVCAEVLPEFTPVQTRANDPALLIYTSGTTGNPKGALHAHRVLLGHLPGVELSHDFLPHENDRFWTPADWAWIGGLLDVLMPALHHGIAVVACRFARFTPQAAFDLICDHSIRNVFLPPTALKMIRQTDPASIPNLRLRSVASGGEALGDDLIAWGRATLGVTINEFYGQTECNMIVSCCAALEPPAPGMMGRAVPGHQVDVINPDTGIPVQSGIEGSLAVLSPDPVMFLGYWNNPSATAEKFVEGPAGRWLLTGDRGMRDAEGRLRFLGRDDDVIGSAGYRIGPVEVEQCLMSHPAVNLAGVVGKPDPLRGSVVAAYIVLNEGIKGTPELADEISAFVRHRLSAHEYPRSVRFIAEMPLTTTGKIMRRVLRELAEAEIIETL